MQTESQGWDARALPSVFMAAVQCSGRPSSPGDCNVLNPEIVAEAKRLLAAGKTCNAVAKRLSISRASVQAIAANRRRVTRDRFGGLPVGPPQRCPECGAMVYRDCQVCVIRNSSGRPSGRDGTEKDVRPNLIGEHRARYERVRQCRTSCEEAD